MNDAIQYFLGEHDFKVFVSDEVIKDNYHRTITKVDIKEDNNIITISFTGTGFMKYQVRNMVGTLIKVGNGKLEPSTINELFLDYSKKKYITTAKAEGLYLESVVY